MDHASADSARYTGRSSSECAELIRKLRWIGLEDEAQHLQRALSRLPAEERSTVTAGPFSTD